MIIKIAEGNLKTKFGEYREYLFYDGLKESIALVMGDVAGAEDVLCRVHSSCIFAHVFNSIECDCREQMEISQQLINEAGRGIDHLARSGRQGERAFRAFKKHRRQANRV